MISRFNASLSLLLMLIPKPIDTQSLHSFFRWQFHSLHLIILFNLLKPFLWRIDLLRIIWRGKLSSSIDATRWTGHDFNVIPSMVFFSFPSDDFTTLSLQFPHQILNVAEPVTSCHAEFDLAVFLKGVFHHISIPYSADLNTTCFRDIDVQTK